MSEDDSNNGGIITGILSLAVIIALGVWIYNSWIKSEWQALYDDGMSSQSLATFGNKEACLDYIHERGSGECGKNCEPPKSPTGLYICQETAD